MVQLAQATHGQQTRSVVGVIGGMGPAAAAYFCLRAAEGEDAGHEEDHLHVVLDDNASVPDRTEFLLGGTRDSVPVLVRKPTRLAKAGAGLLMMARNPASPFTDRVTAGATVPPVDGEAASAVVGGDPGQPRSACWQHRAPCALASAGRACAACRCTRCSVTRGGNRSAPSSTASGRGGRHAHAAVVRRAITLAGGSRKWTPSTLR